VAEASGRAGHRATGPVGRGVRRGVGA
jgi:hypothetical protein